jgi:two-component system nitrate/nitrite response regulator NarL
MADRLASVSLVVLDRSPIFVEGLRALFTRHPGLAMRRVCQTIDSVLTTLSANRADILLVSAQLAVPDAVLLARRVKDVSPATRLLFMANSDSFASVVSRSKAISSVFIVSRAIEPDRLAWVIRRVAEGNDLPEGFDVEPEAPEPAVRDDIRSKLTSREMEISNLVAEGLSNKLIAERFRIREGTVKVHLSNIFQKLGVGNRIGLIRMLEMR